MADITGMALAKNQHTDGPRHEHRVTVHLERATLLALKMHEAATKESRGDTIRAAIHERLGPRLMKIATDMCPADDTDKEVS